MADLIAAKTTTRIPSLDGLRGVAAVVVVLHHALITYPVLRAVFEDGPAVSATGSLPWWLVQTPLHLFWAGGEAVFVFFILSGVALGLMRKRASPARWRSYYPSRLLRLYLPVWASIIFALAVFASVGLVSKPAQDGWVAERGTNLSPISLMKAAFFLRDTDKYNGPLWSLLWEVIFSVLLPAFVFLLLRRSQNWKFAAIAATLLLGCVLRSQIAPVGNFLLYMSIFGLGVLFAARMDDFQRLGKRIDEHRSSKIIWLTAIVIGCVALCSYWYFQPLGLPLPLIHLTYALQVAGAFLIVFCAAFSAPVRRLFSSRVARWLGGISFSLYLVHDPVLLALNHLTGERSQPLVIAIGLPLSIGVGWLFSLLIEHPAHALAKRVERRAGLGAYADSGKRIRATAPVDH
jgi:peptidoglycan/LPS O-acetylase OafA/YrhL